MGFETIYRKAPDLCGNAWINSEPIILHELENTIVLLHFFDCASVKSLETIAYTRILYQQYGKDGLLVIGVHAPLLSFGKKTNVVAHSLHRFNIWYPIVLDNEWRITTAYQVYTLPTLCLIDKDNQIRYRWYEEDSVVEFERALRQLLSVGRYDTEISEELVFSIKMNDISPIRQQRHSIDIPLGYNYGMLGNPEGYNRELRAHYVDPQFYLPNRFYLNGLWVCERDRIYAIDDSETDNYIVVPYETQQVYATIESKNDDAQKVMVISDGSYLSEVCKGHDIQISEAGESFVEVSNGRLYQLVSQPAIQAGTLLIKPMSENVVFYSVAFTSVNVPASVSLN